MAQFQVGHKHKFCVMAGIKTGIPLEATYRTYYRSLKTYFYNPSLHPQEIDYKEYSEEQYPEKSLNLGIALSLSAEICVKWKLGNRWALSLGGYVDYGINNIYIGDKNQPLFLYNSTNRPKNNSILASQYPDGSIKQKAYTNKVSPLASGIKLRLSFGIFNKQNINNTSNENENSL
jgi:hypothetical protein